MFPNPQDALPLPVRPNLLRYKKLAKELVKACKSSNMDAIRLWVEQWIHTLAKLVATGSSQPAIEHIPRANAEVESFIRRRMPEGGPNGGKCALTDAQFVLARSHGFESWPKFAKHLEALAQKSSPAAKFEQAADAIVSGDISALKKLLRENPSLVRATSAREHGATLLHYVAANGVENYRQKTPKNIVVIAELLLGAGSEIDATANMYGGACTTLGLAGTSIHSERAGVQKPLLQTLLDHGASLERHNTAGNRQSLITACLANGRARAAEFLARHGTRLDLVEAAGIGRLDVVKGFLAYDGSLKSPAIKKQLQDALIYASEYGRADVVEFLLSNGVNATAQSPAGQTALHCAVIGGFLSTVILLLKHGAPMEVKNMYGGTVLGQALWSAAHGGDPDVYIPILDALAAAGAKIPKRHVPVNPSVDTWLAQRGSHAEPNWRWHGEE